MKKSTQIELEMETFIDDAAIALCHALGDDGDRLDHDTLRENVKTHASEADDIRQRLDTAIKRRCELAHEIANVAAQLEALKDEDGHIDHAVLMIEVEVVEVLIPTCRGQLAEERQYEADRESDWQNR